MKTIQTTSNLKRKATAKSQTVLRCLNLCALIGIGSCGTADPSSPGRCATAGTSGAVASSKDSLGKPWLLQVSPSSRTVQCATANTEGIMQFIARVEDSLGLPIAGVSIGASVPELSGLRIVNSSNLEDIKKTFKNSSSSPLKFYPTDESTDSCGIAVVTLIYTCPPSPGLSVGGDLSLFSGPLFSEPAQITITLTEPEE